MGKLIGGICLALIAVLGFYIMCMNHIGIQHIGIAYDSWNGTVSIQQPGWHQTGPQVQVAEVSLLPTRVCLNSGARVLNCKQVRFKAEGVQAFIAEQGFHYYDTSGSSSGNDCDSCGGMTRILKGYAYSGKDWPFLEVIEETVLHQNADKK